VTEPKRRLTRAAGIVGTAVGVAAAGAAAAVAAERAVVRHYKRDARDPYGRQPFGRQPYDEKRIVETADGTDIYVEIVEPKRPQPRPTLVFVHGFCLDMGTFYLQREALTRRGEFRMVFYDQPGHGLSGRLETGEYELSALGKTLRAVIQEVVPEGPIVLIGHSMGGMTIMAFAELYPEMFGERVVGTVLMATSGGRIEETKLGLPALAARVGGPLLPLLNNATRLHGGLIDRTRKVSSDLSWLLTRRYGFGDRRPSPALVSFVEMMNSRTSIDTVVRYLRTLYTHSRYPALEALKDTPTLVIVGARDMITPVTHSEEIMRRLPDARYVKVPDSGHVVMLEHADQVSAALSEFLAEVAAPR
jgi:pimeloyl-ACP methyl ester carboxylesterase